MPGSIRDPRKEPRARTAPTMASRAGSSTMVTTNQSALRAVRHADRCWPGPTDPHPLHSGPGERPLRRWRTGSGVAVRELIRTASAKEAPALAVPAQLTAVRKNGLRPDQEQMAPPVPAEATEAGQRWQRGATWSCWRRSRFSRRRRCRLRRAPATMATRSPRSSIIRSRIASRDDPARAGTDFRPPRLIVGHGD